MPLGLAFLEIQSLQRQLPIPAKTDLFVDRPHSDLPGAILALPLVVWLLRRLLGRIFPSSRIWGVERPALETWTAILAFAPVVGWLGNPAWWRETLPRLTHYYTLSHDRQSALPDIQIIYFGQIYEFNLPWHNAWVLLGITVPVTILLAGGDRHRLGARPDSPRSAAALLPGPFSDPPRSPDAADDPRARRRPAFPAHLLLPGGLRGMGNRSPLAERLARRLRRPTHGRPAGPGGGRAGPRGTRAW